MNSMNYDKGYNCSLPEVVAATAVVISAVNRLAILDHLPDFLIEKLSEQKRFGFNQVDTALDGLVLIGEVLTADQVSRVIYCAIHNNQLLAQNWNTSSKMVALFKNTTPVCEASRNAWLGLYGYLSSNHVASDATELKRLIEQTYLSPTPVA